MSNGDKSATFVPKQPTRNRVCCSVPGCNSRGKADRNLSFHLWPKKGALNVRITNSFNTVETVDCHAVWMHRLRMGKNCSRAMKVCSRHFTRDDFFYQGENTKKVRLKKDAIPSLHLPTAPSHGTEKTKSPYHRKYNNSSTDRQEKMQQRDACKAAQEEVEDEQRDIDEVVIDLLNNNESEKISFYGDIEAAKIDHQNNNNTEPLSTFTERSESPQVWEEDLEALRLLEICKRSVGVQVETDHLRRVEFISSITSDAILNTFTGIPTLTMLAGLVSIIEKRTNFSNRHRLSVKEKVVLTVLKIKQDLSYSMIAALFQVVSRQSCARVFKNTVKILAEVLGPTIPWVSREGIDDNMPLCFEKYQKTRIVLDCTEISIERPKCLRCRIRCFSQYKSNFRIKYLTGVSPAGLITYVSAEYGGRASDEKIFLESGLLSKLTRSDAIMVDRGFLIDAECASHNIDLIRPPFLHDRKQFSHEEAEYGRGIAAARVHIERANHRIKIFKMLKNRFPWALVHYADDIFNIVCAILNMSSPILANDKF